MNITIDTEDSQEMLEYYRMKVEVVEKDVKKSIARLKRYQAIVDQLEYGQELPSITEANTEVPSLDPSDHDSNDSNDSAVVNEPPAIGVKSGTIPGPYKVREQNKDVPKNLIAKTEEEAIKHFAPKRKRRLKGVIEEPETKSFQRPPATYSNNKSLYAEMNS